MGSYKHYNRYEKENKGTFTVICLLILVCLIVLGILTVCGVLDDVTWKPEMSYPMANAKVTWAGAGYNGLFAR